MPDLESLCLWDVEVGDAEEAWDIRGTVLGEFVEARLRADPVDSDPAEGPEIELVEARRVGTNESLPYEEWRKRFNVSDAQDREIYNRILGILYRDHRYTDDFEID